jgi:hypothetical protein
VGAARVHADDRAQLPLGRLSAIAGMTLDGSIHFRVYDGSIRSEQVIKYLE